MLEAQAGVNGMAACSVRCLPPAPGHLPTGHLRGHQGGGHGPHQAWRCSRGAAKAFSKPDSNHSNYNNYENDNCYYYSYHFVS